MNLNQILGDDAKYVNNDSAAALERLPDAAWPILLVAANHECDWDDGTPPPQIPGIDCTVAVTHQPLEDFERAHQHEEQQ